MSNMADAIKKATTIFGGIRRYEASETEKQELATRIAALEERGLSRLNKRLANANRNVEDVFAEHNFAYELIDKHPADVPLLYEPKEYNGRTLKRPPDFVLRKNGITFWIQMKRLSKAERENRQSKIIEKIKERARKIPVNKFFGLSLSEDFACSDIETLIEFMSEVAADSIDNNEYPYLSSGRIKAKLTFWKPNKAILQGLTMGVAEDLNFVNVTGQGREQIRRSLINAAKAFEWNTDDENINLVAIEIGTERRHKIDLGEAVFGDEVVTCHNNKTQWRRRENGFFASSAFSHKVAGVIAVTRKESRLTSRYNKLLFTNERFNNKREQICLVMDFDEIKVFNDWIDA